MSTNTKPVLAGHHQAGIAGTTDQLVKCFYMEKLLYELSIPGHNANQYIQQVMAARNVGQMLNSVNLLREWLNQIIYFKMKFKK